MTPKKCPVKGCRKTKPHDHLQPERSTERDRLLTYVVQIPFYGTDEKAELHHLNVARALSLSVDARTVTAQAEVWDEQEMPEEDDDRMYIVSTPFARWGHDQLEEVE